MHTQKNEHDLVSIATIANDGAELPHYASSGASGADVKAFIPDSVVIPAGSSCLIPTGLRFAIPHGYEIQVRPRSGLALKHQISVLNTPGTIDADYRGEVGVILINFGKEPFIVTPGMRIAQFIVAPVLQATFNLTEELAQTVRGSGGFGHTGTK
ncbi:MAG: dUTP diphosphatase [Parachlamydiaceae bacterium]